MDVVKSCAVCVFLLCFYTKKDQHIDRFWMLEGGRRPNPLAHVGMYSVCLLCSCMSVRLFVCPSVCLFVGLFVCLLAALVGCVCLYVCMFVWLACLVACLLAAAMLACLLVCLFVVVCVFACLSDCVALFWFGCSVCLLM